MNIVLVQPPSYDWYTPSNGLALIQAHVKKAGFRPIVVDSSIRVQKALSARLRRKFKDHPSYHRALKRNSKIASELLAREIDEVLSKEPDVAAFAVLGYTEKWSLEMASVIKRRRPACRIVFGGPNCLREASAFDYARNPDIDAVVAGEGDVSFVMLLRAMEKHPVGDLPRIAGILARQDGKVVDGGDEDGVAQMDALPLLDFGGFPMSDYEDGAIYLNTTRSCVYRCRFCTHFLQQKYYDTMSPERTVEEVSRQLDVFPSRRLVVFSDSLVNGDIPRLSKLADLLTDFRMRRLAKGGKDADFGWTGMAILHPKMTPELLRRLVASGCRMLSYGLESGSQKVVDLMDKRFKLAQAEQVIRDTHAAGIRARAYIQCGFPGETEEDLQMTLDVIRRNARHLDQISISFSEIYKGSDLDHRPQFYGIRTPIKDRTKWVSRDGSNTYAVRLRRCRRVAALAREVGVEAVEVFASKLGY